jgi:hypothetical protein
MRIRTARSRAWPGIDSKDPLAEESPDRIIALGVAAPVPEVTTDSRASDCQFIRSCEFTNRFSQRRRCRQSIDVREGSSAMSDGSRSDRHSFNMNYACTYGQKGQKIIKKMAMDWPIFPHKCRAHTPKTEIIFRATDFRDQCPKPAMSFRVMINSF